MNKQFTEDFFEVVNAVEKWSIVRQLNTADSKAQALKVFEEIQEIVVAEELDELKDAIGDTLITLIILNQQVTTISFRELIKAANDINIVSSDQDPVLSEFIITGIGNISSGLSKGHLTKVTQGMNKIVESLLTIIRIEEICFGTKLTMTEALKYAYNEIKNRKGMLIKGTYIKYEDLNSEQQAILDKE